MRSGRELLLDLLVEPVAQAAGERDGDAGKALLEVLDPAVMRAGRPGAVEHQGFFELRLLVQRVDALGMRERRATAERRDEQHRHPRRLRQRAHGRFLASTSWLIIHPWNSLDGRKSGKNREERQMQRHDVDRRLFLGASAVTLLGAAGAARAQAPQAAKAGDAAGAKTTPRVADFIAGFELKDAARACGRARPHRVHRHRRRDAGGKPQRARGDRARAGARGRRQARGLDRRASRCAPRRNWRRWRTASPRTRSTSTSPTCKASWSRRSFRRCCRSPRAPARRRPRRWRRSSSASRSLRG